MKLSTAIAYLLLPLSILAGPVANPEDAVDVSVEPEVKSYTGVMYWNSPERRLCPHLNCASIGNYKKGSRQKFTCETVGDKVESDVLWAKDLGGHWVSDAYILWDVVGSGIALLVLLSKFTANTLLQAIPPRC